MLALSLIALFRRTSFVRAFAFAFWISSGVLARANTEADLLTCATDLDTGISYNSGRTPTTTNDLTFTSSAYTTTVFTLNTVSLNIGTLDDLDVTQALEISAARALTLSGGSDSVSGSTAGDLLYLTSGANLTYGGMGSIALAASGNFDTAGTSQATINTAISGANFTLIKTGTGTLALNGNNTYSGGTNFASGTLNVGNAGALGKR